MRTPSILALVLVLTAGLAAPAAALPLPEVRLPDGFTAKITFPGSIADLVLIPDAGGNIPVEITLFRNVAGTWQQVGMGASLRAFTSLPEADAFSRYFISSATAPTTILMPAADLDGLNFYDIFVTFNTPERPTSHHNVVKNELIDLRVYNTAEYLDYHGTHRPLLLAAPAAPGVPALPVDVDCITGGADPATCVTLPA